jgi:hypothetical protein
VGPLIESTPISLRARIPRAVWHTVGVIFAALLAYAVWLGYQNPDFLLDLGAFQLC